MISMMVMMMIIMMMMIMMMMMMMIMIMMMMINLQIHVLSSILGLKTLPSFSPSSQLKRLMAKDWSIESLPEDFFHFQLEEVNLDGNKGKY